MSELHGLDRQDLNQTTGMSVLTGLNSSVDVQETWKLYVLKNNILINF